MEASDLKLQAYGPSSRLPIKLQISLHSTKLPGAKNFCKQQPEAEALNLPVLTTSEAFLEDNQRPSNVQRSFSGSPSSSCDASRHAFLSASFGLWRDWLLYPGALV